MEKTVAFYGGDSQTGTTMLAVSTAVLMARQGKRVLMIAASDHSGDLWIPTSEGNFLDDLLTDLQEHSLTWEKIRQYILTEAGVDFLPGIRENHRDDFHEKDLSQICWLAEMHYDRILVDCGCGPATGLTAAAVRSGERAVVVITQQEKCLLRLQKKMQMLDRLLPPQRLYAVNKYHDSRAFYTKRTGTETGMYAGRSDTDSLCTVWMAGGNGAENTSSISQLSKCGEEDGISAGRRG